MILNSQNESVRHAHNLDQPEKKKKAVATLIPLTERKRNLNKLAQMTFEMSSCTLLRNTTLTTLQPVTSSATRLNGKAPAIEGKQRKRTIGQEKNTDVKIIYGTFILVDK